jgi:hypothetical protein
MFAKTVPGPGLKGKGGLSAAPLDKPYYAGDLESGPDALYPGISVSEQGLRWGFIQKVGWRVAPVAVRAEALAVDARGRRTRARLRRWSAPSVGGAAAPAAATWQRAADPNRCGAVRFSVPPLCAPCRTTPLLSAQSGALG